MGGIMEARCYCGYHAPELTEGCGFEGVCWDIVSCTRCRRLSSVRADKTHRCPKCGGSVRVIELQIEEEDPSAAEDEDEMHYPCPACGRTTLRLALKALWD